MREGDSVSQAHGIKGGNDGSLEDPPSSWRHEPDVFRKWARGETGFPFVDACMREITATGWMSNRGRQNVASFLTLALGQDWRLGAELFESLLLDHDAAINLVNW